MANLPGSLEYDCEEACLSLIRQNPALFALNPRHAEFFDDEEPKGEVNVAETDETVHMEGSPGNLPNPSLSVQCQKNGLYVCQTNFFKVTTQMTMWIETDEETEQQGIDGLYNQLESIFDDYLVHQKMMAIPEIAKVVDIEFTRQKTTQRRAYGNRYERIYGMEMIASRRQ